MGRNCVSLHNNVPEVDEHRRDGLALETRGWLPCFLAFAPVDQIFQSSGPESMALDVLYLEWRSVRHAEKTCSSKYFRAFLRWLPKRFTVRVLFYMYIVRIFVRANILWDLLM